MPAAGTISAGSCTAADRTSSSVTRPPRPVPLTRCRSTFNCRASRRTAGLPDAPSAAATSAAASLSTAESPAAEFAVLPPLPPETEGGHVSPAAVSQPMTAPTFSTAPTAGSSASIRRVPSSTASISCKRFLTLQLKQNIAATHRITVSFSPAGECPFLHRPAKPRNCDLHCHTTPAISAFKPRSILKN